MSIAQKYLKTHPAIVFQNDALLRSINDRLGALNDHLGVPSRGENIASLSDDWLRDIIDLHIFIKENEEDGGGVPDDDDPTSWF